MRGLQASSMQPWLSHSGNLGMGLAVRPLLGSNVTGKGRTNPERVIILHKGPREVCS